MATDLVPLRPPPRWELPPGRPGISTRARWLSRRALPALRRLPRAVRAEVRPIRRGTVVTYQAWRGWKDVHRVVAAAPGADPNRRLAALAEVEVQSRNRRKLTAVAVLLTGGVVTWAAVTNLTWVALGVLLLVIVLDLVGRGNPRTDGTVRDRVLPFREGASLRSVVSSVRDSLTEQKLVVSVTSARYRDANGVGLTVECVHRVTADHVEGIERRLGTYQGAVAAIEQRGLRGTWDVAVLWSDPLATLPTVEAARPGSLSVHDPLLVGRGADGEPFQLRLLRTHHAVVGRSRSGKSRALWRILERLTACRDVVVHGIDVSYGPALDTWGPLLANVAHETAHAERVLDELTALAQSRGKELGRRAADPWDTAEQDHHPTVDEPQHVVVVDELAQLPKPLREKLTTLARIGAKSAVTVVIAGQGAGKDDFENTVLREQMAVKIALSCSRNDTLMFLGKDARDRGARPDMLHVAQGEQINDAGIAFVDSPDHTLGQRYRFAGMSQAEVKQCVRDRTSIAPPRTVGDEVIDGCVLSEVQIAVAAVFDAERADWLPTRVLLAGLSGDGIHLTDQQLADEMGQRAERGVYAGQRVRGYPRP